MPRKNDVSYIELAALMEERSRRILDKFGKTILSGVKYPKLLSVLEDTRTYWKDITRPALTSFCCEAVGGSPDAAVEVSLMITLVAAGMGIHDDIVDRSSSKHFRMTILGLHSPDEALVAGDLLIVKALTAVREAFIKERKPKKIENVIKVYEDSFVEMCEGEFMEISCRRDLDVKLKYYKEVLWKFGSDTEACAKLGAILGNGSRQEIQALGEFGRRLGFMSRLGGDVKDCLNTEGNLSQRLTNESVPLPILYSAKISKKKHFEIKSILEKQPIQPLDVRNLLEICFEAEAFAYMLGIAKQNARKARYKLSLLKPSPARNALGLMIEKSLADVTNLCL